MTTISASAVKDLREKTGLGMMQCKKALEECQGDIEKSIELLRKQGATLAAKRQDRDAKEGRVFQKLTPSTAVAVELNCETDFVAASDDFTKFGQDLLELILKEKPSNLEAIQNLQINGKQVAQINTDIMAKIGEKISIRRFVIENIGPNEFVSTYSHAGGKIGVVVKLSAQSEIQNKSILEELGKDVAMQIAAASPLALDPSGISPEVIAKEKEIYLEQTAQEGKTGPVADRIVEGRIAKFYKENCLIHQIFVKDSKITIEKLMTESAKTLNIPGLKISGFHRLQLGQ